MHYQQYGVIVLLLALVAGLIFSKRSPALWFGGALLLSYLVGWLPLEKALQNFANPSLVTLLLLLLVSIAIEKSQLVTWLSQGFQGKRLSSVIARLSLSCALMSAFINNTAVVATLMSSLRHHNHFAASKLLLPLSYSAILGGMLTLIGTSTNLIVNGFIGDALLVSVFIVNAPLAFFLEPALLLRCYLSTTGRWQCTGSGTGTV